VLLIILDAAPAPGAEEVIVLGSTLSLTGAYAPSGAHARDGYEIALREINKKGGVKIAGKRYRLVFRYYDDGSNPARALALAKQLIERDGVRFMLGPSGSGPAKAILPVVDEDKVPMVGGGEAPELFSKGYRYNFGIGPTADRCLVPAIHFAAENAAKLGKTKETLKVALVMPKESFAQDVRAGVLEEVRRHGMRLVIDDELPLDAGDISVTLRKVEMLRPDVFLISGQEKGALTAIRQIRAMKIDVPILALTHCDTAKIAEALGKDAEYVFCAQQWHRSLGFKDELFGAAEDFAGKFEQAYKYEASPQAAQSAAAAQVLAESFERAQSLDPEAVRHAIAETDLETFYGPVKFDASGRNIAKSMVLTQIQNGKHVVVAPAEWATDSAVMIPAERKP